LFYASELESEVEMVRLDVIQKRTVGSPVEIESMNSQLAIISRQIADLRSKSTILPTPPLIKKDEKEN
jgi:hypothetical protein